MSDDPTVAKPKRRPEWKTVLLVVSLGLNLLIFGAAVGFFLRGGIPPNPLADAEMRFAYGALSAEAKKTVRAKFRAERSELRRKGRELQAAFREVQASLRADPFSDARFASALAERRRLFIALAERGHMILTNVVAELPPSERAKLAERLAEQRKRKRPRRE